MVSSKRNIIENLKRNFKSRKTHVPPHERMLQSFFCCCCIFETIVWLYYFTSVKIIILLNFPQFQTHTPTFQDDNGKKVRSFQPNDYQHRTDSQLKFPQSTQHPFFCFSQRPYVWWFSGAQYAAQIRCVLLNLMTHHGYQTV